VPEWLKGTGCKPVGASLRWFESNPAQFQQKTTGRNIHLQTTLVKQPVIAKDAEISTVMPQIAE
jgi:hypothetical protein